MAITLATAQAHLDDALEQLTAARKAASVSGGGRSYNAQALADLREEVTYWQRAVNELTADASSAKNPQVAIAIWT